MKLRAVLLAAVVALLFGNAVALVAYDPPGLGPDGRPLASGPAASEQAPEASVATSLPGALPSAPAGSAPATAPSAGSGAQTPASPSTTTPPPPPYTYEVTLTPTCVLIGQPLTLTMRLKKGSGAAIQVMYADGSTDPPRVGMADDKGLFTHTWTAAPAPGVATAATVASNPETGGGGTTAVDFRVVGVTERC